MTMTRRSFLETSLSGMALYLAQKDSRADQRNPNQPSPDPAITVIGVDGSMVNDANGNSVPDPALIGDYLQSHADVWQYSDNVIDLPYLQRIENFVETNASRIVLTRSYKDILTAKKSGKVAMVVGCQELTSLEPEWTDVSTHKMPNDWRLVPPITDLRAHYDNGLRIANLAYNTSNFFGGGCLDPRTPLNRAGEVIVSQMQEIGILVDCSHSSDRTTLDILRMAKRPVVCSHSNVDGLNDNPRNVSDRIIEGVAKTGGLIGVNALNCLLAWSRQDAPNADDGPFPAIVGIRKYVDVMDYIRRLVGIDYIGIGADFGAAGFKAPPPTKSFIYPPEMTYNQPDGLQYVKNFESVLDLPVLRAELVRRGYSSTDIPKVLGGNWMRVFREAWNS
jgi:membrane dipeptidase